MLVVIAELTVKPGKKNELFELAQAVIAATRAEEGCVSYTLLNDPYEETACSFVEEWTDKSALKRHLQAPHLLAWRQQSAPLVTGETKLTLYEAEATTLA